MIKSRSVGFNMPAAPQKECLLQPYERHMSSGGVVTVQPSAEAAAAARRKKKKSLSSFDPALHAKPGTPRGLEYLSTLDTLRVYQYQDIVEATMCWVRSNKYRICNDKDQQFFMAKDSEEDENDDSQCCTQCRSKHVYVTTIDDNRGLTAIRLVRTVSWWYPNEMEIYSPPGNLIGKIRERATVFACYSVCNITSGLRDDRLLPNAWCSCYTVFHLLDDQDQELYIVQVPPSGNCTLKCCADLVYKIRRCDDKESEIGEIRRLWSGCKDMLMPSSDITVTFHEDTAVLHKAMFVAVTLLIDYKFLESTL